MSDMKKLRNMYLEPNFLAFIGLVGVSHLLFGALCFMSNYHLFLSTKFFILGIFILVLAVFRIWIIFLIYSYRTHWVLIALIPTIMEVLFGLYLLLSPDISLAKFRVPAAFYMLVCGVAHFIYAYSMKIQGMSSFSFAIGIMLSGIAAMIYLNLPSPTAWNPWLVMGAEFWAVGAVSIWLVYYLISDKPDIVAS